MTSVDDDDLYMWTSMVVEDQINQHKIVNNRKKTQHDDKEVAVDLHMTCYLVGK